MQRCTSLHLLLTGQDTWSILYPAGSALIWASCEAWVIIVLWQHFTLKRSCSREHWNPSVIRKIVVCSLYINPDPDNDPDPESWSTQKRTTVTLLSNFHSQQSAAPLQEAWQMGCCRKCWLETQGGSHLWVLEPCLVRSQVVCRPEPSHSELHTAQRTRTVYTTGCTKSYSCMLFHSPVDQNAQEQKQVCSTAAPKIWKGTQMLKRGQVLETAGHNLRYGKYSCERYMCNQVFD